MLRRVGGMAVLWAGCAGPAVLTPTPVAPSQSAAPVAGPSDRPTATVSVAQPCKARIPEAASRRASFFEEVRHQVQMAWHPKDVLRQHDPTGEAYRRSNRLTLVDVTLSRAGHLVDVSTALPSGLDLFDEEALRAFRVAQPFPRPPPDVVAGGFCKFQFGFLYDFSGKLGAPKLIDHTGDCEPAQAMSGAGGSTP